MKRLKNIIALLLAFVMILGMLAGCAAVQGKTDAPAAEADKTTGSEEKPSSGEYPVVSWYLMSADANVRDLDAVQAAANEILREKIGIEIQLYFLSGTNFTEKMNVMMNAGDEMDIMAGGAYTGTEFDTAFRTGSLLALDDLLNEYGQDILAKSDARGWESVTRNGKIYAIPSNMPWASGNILSWRKDLVEKYSIDIDSIKTAEDLEPVLAMIKENEPDVIPINNCNTESGNTSYVFANAAVVGKASPVVRDLLVFNYDTQKMESWFDQSEIQDVYRKMADFYQKGYTPSDALARTDNAVEYKSGDYLVFHITAEFTGGSKSTGICGYDCLESLINYSEITTGSMNEVCTYISATSKQPENAMKVINAVWSDPALLNLLAYGIEGANYTVVGTDKNGNPSVEPKSGDEQRWAVFHNFWGPLWDQWDSPWNSTEALEAMKEANVNSPASQIVGFSFDQEPVKTQMAEILAIKAEVLPVLITGVASDVDAYLDEVHERLEAAGMSEVLAEAQRQYEEWLKIK